MQLLVGAEGHATKLKELAAHYANAGLYTKKQLLKQHEHFFGDATFSILLSVQQLGIVGAV